MNMLYTRKKIASTFALVLVVQSNTSIADIKDNYVCTYRDRIEKDFRGNELPASIMKIDVQGDVADVVETSFSADSDHIYEGRDTYDVRVNDKIGLILVSTRTGRHENEMKSTFISTYTIIINRDKKRFTYGYI